MTRTASPRPASLDDQIINTVEAAKYRTARRPRSKRLVRRNQTMKGSADSIPKEYNGASARPIDSRDGIAGTIGSDPAGGECGGSAQRSSDEVTAGGWHFVKASE